MFQGGEKQEGLAKSKALRNPGPDVSHLLHVNYFRLEVLSMNSEVNVLPVEQQRTVMRKWTDYCSGCQAGVRVALRVLQKAVESMQTNIAKEYCYFQCHLLHVYSEISGHKMAVEKIIS